MTCCTERVLFSLMAVDGIRTAGYSRYVIVWRLVLLVGKSTQFLFLTLGAGKNGTLLFENANKDGGCWATCVFETESPMSQMAISLQCGQGRP